MLTSDSFNSKNWLRTNAPKLMHEGDKCSDVYINDVNYIQAIQQ